MQEPKVFPTSRKAIAAFLDAVSDLPTAKDQHEYRMLVEVDGYQFTIGLNVVEGADETLQDETLQDERELRHFVWALEQAAVTTPPMFIPMWLMKMQDGNDVQQSIAVLLAKIVKSEANKPIIVSFENEGDVAIEVGPDNLVVRPANPRRCDVETELAVIMLFLLSMHELIPQTFEEALKSIVLQPTFPRRPDLN